MSQKASAGGWMATLGAAAAAAIFGAVAAAAAVWLAFAGGGPSAEAGALGVGPGDMQGVPPALVALKPATAASLQDRFEVVGRLREIKRSTVASEVEGKVLMLPVEEGDPVEGGKTVLAEIEGVWTNLALQAAEAELTARIATADQAQRDYDQLTQLSTLGSAKPREVDDARATLASQRAAVEAAVALRDRVAEETDRLRIVAPFDGVVVGKMTEVGQWVERGSPVVEIISAGQIDAVIDVPEHLINIVTLGSTLDVHVEALGETVQGQVASITPSGANAARTFPVKIRLDDGGGRLRAGMSVIGKLPMGEESQRLTVPRDAVQFNAQGPVVWVALPQDGQPMPQALPVPVKVLFAVDGRLVVEPVGGEQTPLHPDTLVVTEGAERLFPTQPLMTNEQ